MLSISDKEKNVTYNKKKLVIDKDGFMISIGQIHYTVIVYYRICRKNNLTNYYAAKNLIIIASLAKVLI